MQLQNCICKMAHSVVQNDIKTFYKVRKKVHVLSDIIVGHEKYKLNYQKKNTKTNVILVPQSVLQPDVGYVCNLLTLSTEKTFSYIFSSHFFISTFLFLIMRKKRLDCEAVWTPSQPGAEPLVWSWASLMSYISSSDSGECVSSCVQAWNLTQICCTGQVVSFWTDSISISDAGTSRTACLHKDFIDSHSETSN